MNIVQIDEFRYMVEMGCNRDSWRCCGMVVGHPDIPDGQFCMPSTPVEFDEENLTFKTISGKTYKIMSFDGNEEEIKNQLKEDVENGGFLIC
jgi:hypothetical protein